MECSTCRVEYDKKDGLTDNDGFWHCFKCCKELISRQNRPPAVCSNDVLYAIRVAKDKLREAKKERCSCSGFVLQYEGSCQCGVGRRISAVQTELNNLVERI